MSPAGSATEAARPRLAALLRRPAAAALLEALGGDGHEARIVGGAVRDSLMGRPVDDIDIAVTRLPDEVIALAARHGWKAIPTGVAHGTVTVLAGGVRHEVTTLRRDVETDGRRAVVAFSRDFREDALRRDFTMNALSLSADGALHDYASGVADAMAGRVRFMGDPETRIREDYLRALRFFRFHASHGSGEPDPAGLAACARLKDGVAGLSRERVRQETLKLLGAQYAVAAAAAMREIGLWPVVLAGGGFDVDRLGRLAALEAALGRRPDAVLRLAAAAADGRGGPAALELQAALALSNAERDRIDAAQEGAIAGAAANGRSAARDDDLRRGLFARGADGMRDAILVAAARENWDAAETRALVERAEALAVGLPGNPYRSADLTALGVPPGPRMGAALRAATAAWLEAGLPKEPARQQAILRAALAPFAG